jgi:hypothetical protein
MVAIAAPSSTVSPAYSFAIINAQASGEVIRNLSN